MGPIICWSLRLFLLNICAADFLNLNFGFSLAINKFNFDRFRRFSCPMVFNFFLIVETLNPDKIFHGCQVDKNGAYSWERERERKKKGPAEIKNVLSVWYFPNPNSALFGIPSSSTVQSRLFLSLFNSLCILKYHKKQRKLCSQLSFFFNQLGHSYFSLTATSCKNVSSGWEN